jgi:hypothetical protein
MQRRTRRHQPSQQENPSKQAGIRTQQHRTKANLLPRGFLRSTGPRRGAAGAERGAARGGSGGGGERERRRCGSGEWAASVRRSDCAQGTGARLPHAACGFASLDFLRRFARKGWVFRCVTGTGAFKKENSTAQGAQGRPAWPAERQWRVG